ncbi:MAG: peptidase S8 and S53 subtilisin kexin sedolisin [Edafosvirus sp.]|uniref:Peptidase S8 and S53 subtilisin kexin sedolisin n=1 Tax=Edafosvirus sp. TaxID=2487765 RepID=A0A3G4ZSN0_9VIRU|nr:MAG: peptidase S8 and S53 subtilisin kexin sedolisin [Edafosvirus sp.]
MRKRDINWRKIEILIYYHSYYLFSLKLMCETKKQKLVVIVILIFIVGAIALVLFKVVTFTQNQNQTNSPFLPGQITKAYGVDKLNTTGNGTIIALIDAYDYPNAQIDFDIFCNTYNLSMQTLIIHKMTNLTGHYPSFNADWSIEQAVDIQWAHAIAPNAQIMLVQSFSDGGNDLFDGIVWAINNGANIISMSWGFGTMSFDILLDNIFLDGDIVFLASSGDSGSIEDYPACSPYVMAIGGTRLVLNNDDTRKEETGWSKSGGGICAIEVAPEYQINSTLGTNSIFRQNPDVSAVADPATPVSIYCNGEWIGTGGTSVASPIWAGIIAHANEARRNIKKSFLSTTTVLNAIYAINIQELSNNNFGTFYDVINGSTNKYSAHVGYDYLTGIGTPNAHNLIYNCLLSA